MKIEPLTVAHVDDAMQLVSVANWNQTRQDWLRLMHAGPRGCFGAWSAEGLIGTITTISYGKELAWIGMMFVAETHRRRGVATMLMRAAMDHLTHQGIASIKLDATPAGRPLYESLGFVSEAPIERWEGVARPRPVCARTETGEALWPAIQLLDRHAFHVDRSGVLSTLFQHGAVLPLAVVAPDDRLVGFALARQGLAARYIGPVVATDSNTAVALIDGMCGQLSNERVFLDLHTGCGMDSSMLSGRHFVKQRDLTRMRYGKVSTAGISRLLVASAGPELG